jgi:hypothetical protein
MIACKTFLLLFFFYLNTFLLQAKQEPIQKYQPFCLITLAKSGSHLIHKALFEITGQKGVWASSGDSIRRKISKKQYLWTHFCVSPQLEKHLSPIKKIILIRDLRDVCISAANAIYEDITKSAHTPKNYLPDFCQLSFSARLACVLKEDCQMKAMDDALVWNFSNSFPQAVSFAKNPQVLVCKYEELVGPNGGGTLEAQYAAIQKIGDFLGICLKMREIKRIASVIYGNSRTFRKGKIENWKMEFDAVHKDLFKDRFNSYLIELGYEVDAEW